MYCKKCGGKLESYASNCAFCGTPVEKYEANANYVKQESSNGEVTHMTTMKWIGLSLLNVIPVIGNLIYLVLIFKWAFGSTKDLTLKCWARASLLLVVIVLAISSLAVLTNLEALKEYFELLQ